MHHLDHVGLVLLLLSLKLVNSLHEIYLLHGGVSQLRDSNDVGWGVNLNFLLFEAEGNGLVEVVAFELRHKHVSVLLLLLLSNWSMSKLNNGLLWSLLVLADDVYWGHLWLSDLDVREM